MSLVDKRQKDKNWVLPSGSNDGNFSTECVTVAVLMDLRDELKEIKNHHKETIRILKQVRGNTSRLKRT